MLSASLHGIARQFWTFSLVGVVGTATHYAILIVLAGALAVHPVPASAGAFVCGAIVNYALNYRITFSSAKDHSKALPQFLAVATVGLGLNSVLMGWLTGRAGLHWFMAQVVATIVVLCWNFAANRLWTFSGDSSDR